MLASVLAISLGAALGALMRWALGLWLNPVHASVPLGTLAANLLGGYLVGLALALFAQHPEWPQAWRLLAITGFLGGLTTFSSFSGEVVTLLQRGDHGWALGLVALHLGGSLALTALGFATARLIHGD